MLQVIIRLHSVWGQMRHWQMLWPWVRVVQLQQTLLMCRLPQLVQSPTVEGLARLLVAARWFLVTKFLLVRQVLNAKSNMLRQAQLLRLALMPLTVVSCSMWPKDCKSKFQILLLLRTTIVLMVVALLMVTIIMMVPLERMPWLLVLVHLLQENMLLL